MAKLYDVIIAGAGPVGLLLASELSLAHASVLVLESTAKSESPWKVMPLGMRGLNTLSVEAMYRRGLLDRLFEGCKRSWFPEKTNDGPKFAGHFAGIALDSNKFELDRWQYRFAGPALLPGPTTTQRIEAVLCERAESSGVTILRDKGITKIIAQDDVSVTVEAGEKQQSFRGRWLVGCDGGRSVVRKAAGFDFIGTEPKYTAYSLKCELDHSEKLNPGFHTSGSGLYIFKQPDCLHLMDFETVGYDRTHDPTTEHLQNVLDRLTGTSDVKIKKVHLASTSTDRCKQASTYRRGRVILAGDAAHIHSPLGAQGLNLGLGDAMNLGWKLAATIRQECALNGRAMDLTLLDTYERERRPIAAWVLEWTRAQVSTLQPDLYGSAVRTLVRDLIDTTDGTNLMIDRAWGLSQRYVLGDGEARAHPLVGCSAPDFEFRDGERLGPKLVGGRGLLIDFQQRDELRDLVMGGMYKEWIDYLGMGAQDTCGLSALLVRPDGIVAWVAEGKAEPDLSAARDAMCRWFGS